MGLLGNLFGGGTSVAKLRKAVSQQRYADARLFAEQLADQELSDTETAEVETLRVEAGDGLAKLNLDEALGLQRCGNFDRASEHLQLAQQQVCSDDLSEKIEQAIATKPLEPEIDVETDLSTCTSCSPQSAPLANPEEAVYEDADTQLELILTSYPATMAVRYATKSEAFKVAFLQTHAGHDDQAFTLWKQLEESEHDDLYWFELGSLLGRRGDIDAANTALETALQQNPELLLAGEALIAIFIAKNDYQAAQQRLQQFLEQGANPSFCHAHLTSLFAQQQNYPTAAEHARLALTAGNREPEFILLAAGVLEHIGALEETEQVLKMVTKGGCGGGTSLPLAEFWLRQKQQLPTILDTFNVACREDPDNPRWQLRVAQTYVARNWTNDGLKLLRKVVGDPRLEPELASEATKLLEELT